MASKDTPEAECSYAFSIPSGQDPALAVTSRLPESDNPLARPCSLKVPPVSRNLNTVASGSFDVTPDLENALWTRYEPLVNSLEGPLNQYLHIDVAYRGCMQQLRACQQLLSEENLSRVEIDRILDSVEKELLCAQYLALWKRGVLLGANQSLYNLTGRKCDSKHEKPTAVKQKKKCKKTVVSTVKENIRRSKRERSSPCASKTKSKDCCSTSVISTPRQTSLPMPPACLRTKRKSKRRESTSESTSSSKRRSSGRVSKPPRKKQSTALESCELTVVTLNDEPTYCLCKQVSFGDMIGCDNDKCSVEWFHFGCVQLKTKPKGKWYCPLCRGDRTNVLKASSVK